MVDRMALSMVGYWVDSMDEPVAGAKAVQTAAHWACSSAAMSAIVRVGCSVDAWAGRMAAQMAGELAFRLVANSAALRGDPVVEQLAELWAVSMADSKGLLKVVA